MPIKIHCPNCDKALNVPARLLGRKGQCPRCQHKFVLSRSLTPRAFPSGTARKKNAHDSSACNLQQQVLPTPPPPPTRIPAAKAISAPTDLYEASPIQMQVEPVPPPRIRTEEELSDADGIPLSAEQLRDLKESERNRRKIRQAATGYRIIFLVSASIGAIQLFFMAIALVLGGARLPARAGGLVVLVMLIQVGLVTFHYILHHFTWRNEQWAPVSAVVFYSLTLIGVWIFIASVLSASSHESGTGEAIAGGGFLLILPTIFVILSVRAAYAIPHFRRSPTWCQRLLGQMEL